MLAFYHPDQQLHDPQQFMRSGRIAAPQDLPARTEALLGALMARGIAPRMPHDCGVDPLLAVHTADYLAFLDTAYARWQGLPGAGIEVLPNAFPYWSGRPDRDARPPCRSTSVIAQAGWYMGDLAVPLGPHTWRSTLRSAQTAVAAADAILAGSRVAYALCRPSGHHARPDRASGFCYVNNSAVAAARLRTRHAKVAVLDVDTHHGDGTQEIFYRRADVLTVSIHTDPTGYYPFFTGYADETGSGAGQGHNLNLPLPPGSGGEVFLGALDGALALIRAFAPGALVVAQGFDAHRQDPLGVLGLTTDDFGDIARRIVALRLPTVLVQEGGYAVDVIGDCLGAVIDGFGATA